MENLQQLINDARLRLETTYQIREARWHMGEALRGHAQTLSVRCIAGNWMPQKRHLRQLELK